MSTGSGCERDIYWSDVNPKTGEFYDKRKSRPLKLKKPKKEKPPESLTKTSK